MAWGLYRNALNDAKKAKHRNDQEGHYTLFLQLSQEPHHVILVASFSKHCTQTRCISSSFWWSLVILQWKKKKDWNSWNFPPRGKTLVTNSKIDYKYISWFCKSCWNENVIISFEGNFLYLEEIILLGSFSLENYTLWEVFPFQVRDKSGGLHLRIELLLW